MANKIYTVVKDGEELEQLKTLAAAKKLANMEGAEIYADGECVYKAESATVSAEETAKTDTAPVVTGSASKKSKESTGQKYRLKALMNIRTKPSFDGEKIGTKKAGEIVDVFAIESDWLHLTDGTYILYQGGDYAEIV